MKVQDVSEKVDTDDCERKKSVKNQNEDKCTGMHFVKVQDISEKVDTDDCERKKSAKNQNEDKCAEMHFVKVRGMSTGDDQCTEAEKEAAIVEKITGTQDIQKEIRENEEVFKGSHDSLTIAKQGGEIKFTSLEGDTVSMKLPLAEDDMGCATDSGTVVYDSSENIFFSVQLLSDDKSVNEVGVRSLITIQNEKASDVYEFAYDLPESMKLSFFRDLDEESKAIAIKDYEASESLEERIFIVDDEGGICGEIEPAWAKDANGNDIETYYEIDGTVLRQHVNLTDTSAFPIVADPTYKLVYKKTGSLKVLGYSAFGIASIISTCAGSVPAAILTTIGSLIVKDRCEKLGYTVKRYICNYGKVTYTKTYLKLWNTKTKKTYSERTYYTKKYKK